MQELEHPDISCCLKWGYPKAFAAPELCDDCGEALGDYAYEYENLSLCEDCFKDRITDFARLCPGEMARALGIQRRFRA